jgi:uncharacterized membrane protein
MGKLEFLDALKRAMTGLAPEVQAKTLAYYEQRFIDGVTAGRSEQEVAQELDDPKKIAMTLRASAHLSAFERKRNPANLLRLTVSALGLAIFNLFMVVPAIVYAALLTSMYACALAFYIAGIAITASGLSGANELVLDGPLRHFVMDADEIDDSNTQTKVVIADTGIRVFQEKAPGPHPGHPQPGRHPGHPVAGEDADADIDADPDADTALPVIKRAEEMAGRGIRISTDMDARSRTTQTLFGLAMVVGAIILFLLSLVVTKYTVVAIKRYIQMNFSLLKGS